MGHKKPLPEAEFRNDGDLFERPCPHDKEVVIKGAPIWEQMGTRGLVAKRGRARGLHISPFYVDG